MKRALAVITEGCALQERNALDRQYSVEGEIFL